MGADAGPARVALRPGRGPGGIWGGARRCELLQVPPPPRPRSALPAPTCLAAWLPAFCEAASFLN